MGKDEDEDELDRVEESARRLMAGRWNLSDYLDQLRNLKKMGPFKQLLRLIPGMSELMTGKGRIEGDELVHIEAIILAMTHVERTQPECLDASRRQRIARGSGTSVREVERLLKQFRQMKKAVRMLGRSGDLRDLLDPKPRRGHDDDDDDDSSDDGHTAGHLVPVR